MEKKSLFVSHSLKISLHRTLGAMRTIHTAKFAIPFTSFCLLLLQLLPSLHIRTPTIAAAQSENDGPTCSIHEPCSTTPLDAIQSPSRDDERTLRDRRIISLTDDNFDRLTWTATPSTWLIMFKTDGCGICRKALPVFELLSTDSSIVDRARTEGGAVESTGTENGGNAGENEERTKNDDGTVEGPIYIATVDASWHGRDTTKRFAIDATPTIIVLRNEGYDANSCNLSEMGGTAGPVLLDAAGNKLEDTRSYFIYRGQRAQYPLRSFVLGGFRLRNKMAVPPPLPEEERKPRSFAGRALEYVKPYVARGGGIILKLLGGWFAFLGVLGLFMRIHNYAWGDDDNDEDYAEKREREIEREKAKGAAEYKGDGDKDARIAERQRKMWEKKMENRAKFAATREARKKKEAEGGGGGEDDDDDMVGIGFAVKKSDIQKQSGKAGPLKPKTS
ncbi:hypothetical protein ACHAW6_004572 [Cyclotella cf. meneghiniana]